MSRDKQTEIEKMQSEIIRWGENADRTGNYDYPLSEHLITAGYRKSTDLAEEIFAGIEVEIAKCFKECFKWEGNTTERREMLNFNARIKMSLGKLKNKYTKGGDKK